MKNAIKIIILILSFTSISFAQRNVDPKNMIGFGCYSGGMQTKAVHDFTILLEKSKYKNFVKYLDSNKTSEKFLAAAVCKKLSEKGKLKLSNMDNQKILAIYSSSELVSVCSGCTSFRKISLRELSKKDKENYMLERIEIWLNQYIK